MRNLKNVRIDKNVMNREERRDKRGIIKGEYKKVDKMNDKEYMLNIDMVDFIIDLKKKKIEISMGNVESIRREYKEKVGLKWSNVYKVGGRVLREEVRDKLKDYVKNEGENEKEILDGIRRLIVVSGNKSIKRRYI